LSTVYIRFAARSAATLERAPLLERLLLLAPKALPVAEWRADAFRVIADADSRLPPVAAAALLAAPDPAQGAWVCVATPVHCVAGMTSISLPENGILELDGETAQTLAGDFNRVWSEAGMRLVCGRSATLLCVVDQSLAAATYDPEEVRGRDIWGFLPGGTDGPRLRQLMSEVEMWLFDHAVNRARTGRGLLPITGLWLWGGGRTLAALPAVSGWTAGRDPLFAAFRVQGEFPAGAGADASAGAGLGAHAGLVGSGVVVCGDVPGTAPWPEVERRWLVPALAALRAGRLAELQLSAADRCFRLTAHRQWRFWRRTRPWWECFGIEGNESHGGE
jgi:hypothetical protein